VVISLQKFFFTKLECGYQNKAQFYADYENLQIKWVQSWSLPLFYIIDLQKFRQITFLHLLYPIISTDLKSAKNSAYFLYSFAKEK
jgi:hypothetical protein